MCSRGAAERAGAVPAPPGEGGGGGRPAREDGAAGVPRHVSPAEEVLQGHPDQGPG